jgi:hypothetical protein
MYAKWLGYGRKHSLMIYLSALAGRWLGRRDFVIMTFAVVLATPKS